MGHPTRGYGRLQGTGQECLSSKIDVPKARSGHACRLIVQEAVIVPAQPLSPGLARTGTTRSKHLQTVPLDLAYTVFMFQ